MKCKWCDFHLEVSTLENPECERCWNIRSNAETNPKVALKISLNVLLSNWSTEEVSQLFENLKLVGIVKEESPA